MKYGWAVAVLLLWASLTSAQQVNQDIVPASPGLRLGHSNQRWNGFFRNMDISGTCIINGTPCGQGGGGTSIATYTVSTLPPSPPINTYAFVTDANGPTCTIGGSSTTNLCRYTGFQWTIVSGGSGSAPTFGQVTAGTNTTALIIGTGGSLTTTGTGIISATNVPFTKTPILNEFFDGYDSSTRLFHSLRPAYSNLSGLPNISEVKTANNTAWLINDTTGGGTDGIKFFLNPGDVSITTYGPSVNSTIDIAGRGTGVVNITNGVIQTLKLPYVMVGNCLTTDSLGVVRDTGAVCGAGGGGSITYPLTAPDGSSSSAQYSFTNHPELGLAVALNGDHPQIRQVVVSGSAGAQTITITISTPMTNLSWKAGDRFIINALPSSPTDLTSLNFVTSNYYVVNSVTATNPTGTATFSATTSITPGTYPVTVGNAQVYGMFMVARAVGFNRITSSSPNPAEHGTIRMGARDAMTARASQPDDSTLDVVLIRGAATIVPSNSVGAGILTVNGAHSSGATTLSVAKAIGVNWSATAGDTILIGQPNGDSDHQKYAIAANVTVVQNANTNITITPALKTALNGGELIVAKYIRTQLGEEAGVELPGDAELKGDLTLTSTKPTLIQVKKQSSTPTLNTVYDAGWYLDSTNHFHCKLSVALGGGDCAPLSSGSGYSIIQDEAVSVATETTVNFTGAGVSCVDNPGSSRTDCTIPGGSGITGSGTTGKVPKFTGAGAIGDSSIDDGVSTASTVTINANGGLNIVGSGAAGFVGLKQGTANSTTANQIGFTGPTSITAYNLVWPAAASNGFVAFSNSSNIVTGAFRSIAATSPITITNPAGVAGDPTLACSTCGVTGTGLGQFASTTSAQLAAVLSNEIGSGLAVFASAYQGSDVNVLSSGTVSGTASILCTDALGGATTVGCNAVTASAPGVGIAHFAGSTQVVTSSAVNLAGADVTGVLPLANVAQQFTTNAQTSTYQVLAADFAACKTITVASGTFTITLVASGSQPADGQCIDVVNYGSGTVTVARSGQNINGAAANQTLAAGSASSPTSLHVVSNGTNYFAETMGVGASAGVTSFSGDGTIITNSGSTGSVTAVIAGTSGGIPYFSSSSAWASSAALTVNDIVLGGGAGAAPKRVAGITTDGTSKVTLGVAGTSVGALKLNNATSGDITLQPPTGALGTVTLTLPTTTDTLVGKTTTDTLTNKTLTTPVITSISNSGTITIPTGTDTLVGRATTDTLTNKTLTTPVISSISNTGTVTIPTSTDTLMGKATTDTMTNKTLDAEGTGNVVTIPEKVWLPGAGCNNATASSFWDLPTSTPAVATCVTGTNTQKGVLAYADTSGGFSAQNELLLPADFSGTIDANIIWSTSATTGNAKWSLSTICTAVGATETDDAAFNTASTVTTAAPGTANRLQTSAITTLTITGCAAGEFMHLKMFRDGNDGSDTIAATANLIGVELTIRRTM